MKKTYFITILLLTLAALSLSAATKTKDKTIVLMKQQAEKPIMRSPELNPTLFTATIRGDEVVVFAQNYEGEATVEITGAGGAVVSNFTVPGSGMQTVNIAHLPEGMYTIFVSTSRGVYQAEVEL